MSNKFWNSPAWSMGHKYGNTTFLIQPLKKLINLKWIQVLEIIIHPMDKIKHLLGSYLFFI